MAVLQMQRISICALKKNRKAILEKLQSMGVMEINQILGEDDDSHSGWCEVESQGCFDLHFPDD